MTLKITKSKKILKPDFISDTYFDRLVFLHWVIHNSNVNPDDSDLTMEELERFEKLFYLRSKMPVINELMEEFENYKDVAEQFMSGLLYTSMNVEPNILREEIAVDFEKVANPNSTKLAEPVLEKKVKNAKQHPTVTPAEVSTEEPADVVAPAKPAATTTTRKPRGGAVKKAEEPVAEEEQDVAQLHVDAAIANKKVSTRKPRAKKDVPTEEVAVAPADEKPVDAPEPVAEKKPSSTRKPRAKKEEPVAEEAPSSPPDEVPSQPVAEKKTPAARKPRASAKKEVVEQAPAAPVEAIEEVPVAEKKVVRKVRTKKIEPEQSTGEEMKTLTAELSEDAMMA